MAVTISTAAGGTTVTVTTSTGGAESTFQLEAAEDIIAKEAVCQSLTEAGKCYKADANDSDKMPVIGIAMESATIGNTLDIYHGGKVTDVVKDGDFSVGSIIYMSTIPGQVTKTPPTVSGTGQQRLGVATGTDDILLDIDLTVMWIP